MSGLYNMVFGVNLLAGPLLHALGINRTIVPRFRDCFLSADGQSIIIYTRTGGGNRSEYEAQNNILRAVTGFIRDEDDAFDNTYALFHYAIPDEIKRDCAELFAKGWGVDPATRWKETIDAMKPEIEE